MEIFMPLIVVPTSERCAALREQAEKHLLAADAMERISPEEMWKSDLIDLRNACEKYI